MSKLQHRNTYLLASEQQQRKHTEEQANCNRDVCRKKKELDNMMQKVCMNVYEEMEE